MNRDSSSKKPPAIPSGSSGKPSGASPRGKGVSKKDTSDADSLPNLLKNFATKKPLDTKGLSRPKKDVSPKQDKPSLPTTQDSIQPDDIIEISEDDAISLEVEATETPYDKEPPTRQAKPLGQEKQKADTSQKESPPASPESEDKKKEVVEAPIVPKNRDFGRFNLLMEMGQGGMATLYLARIVGPEKFEKLVAIKKIHDHLTRDKQFVNMFLDEARIAALIHHPNVATIFDLGRIEGSYFIAMEYVHGQNLTDLLRASVRQRTPIPWSHAVRIVASAAAGLHGAHELCNAEGDPLGVVHRDVSPQNILVSYDGHVKVVDFGIAFAAEKLSHTAAGTLKGKAAYMSPEQTTGASLDRRSDIFSLGIVLYESVCLKRLFREENEAATLLKVRSADVTRPRIHKPDIPAALEKIIMKALAKSPEDRYDTAGDFAEALEELLVAKGEVVSNRKIAKHLKQIFYEKKKVKDKQIKEALRNEALPAMKGVEMMSTSGTSLEMPSVSSSSMPQPTTTSRSLAMILTAGALFAAGAVVLAVVLILHSGASTGKNKETQSPAVKSKTMDAQPVPKRGQDAKPVKKSDVKLKVVVKPEEAPVIISFRGKKYKGSTFQILLPPTDKSENIGVTAEGYYSQYLVVDLTRDKEIPVTLKKKTRPRVRVRPRRRYRPPRRRRGRGLLKELPD